MNQQDRIIEAYTHLRNLREEARQSGDRKLFGMIGQYTDTVQYLKSYLPVFCDTDEAFESALDTKAEMAEMYVQMAEEALDALKD